METVEANIVKRLREGDSQTYVDLFTEYYAPLCAYAKRYLGSRDLAEDIVSDTFFNIWKNREKLDIKVSLKSYLFQAVCKNSLNYLRKNHREEKLDEYLISLTKESELLAGSHSELPLSSLINKDLGEKISIAVDNLPAQQQKVFKLKRYEEKKNKEIAEIMGISEKTVEMHLRNAMLKLRVQLKDYMPAFLVFMVLKDLF